MKKKSILLLAGIGAIVVVAGIAGHFVQKGYGEEAVEAVAEVKEPEASLTPMPEPTQSPTPKPEPTPSPSPEPTTAPTEEKQEDVEIELDEQEATEEKDSVAEEEASDITALDKVMYAQGNVNTRSGPSTDYTKIGGLSVNQEVKVVGQSTSTGWYEIEVNGEKQYVSNKYLGDRKIEVVQEEAENTSMVPPQENVTPDPVETSSTNPDILPGGNAQWDGSDGVDATSFFNSIFQGESPDVGHVSEMEGVHAH